MTTVGYGDYVPKSIIGIIVTCIMALMANTVIFSLPVAILNIEFQELYGSKKESEQISQLKKSIRSGSRDSIKNKEFSFFNQRLQIIEERNKEIQELLNKSNKMAQELTKDLKRLFLSVNDDADQLLDNLNSPKITKQNVLLVKANLYDKLIRAKKKIQITNIFKNLIQDSDQEINESPLNQTLLFLPYHFMKVGLESKKKSSYAKQEIDEMNQKTKPRTPHQFVNYNNNLKDLDKGLKKDEFHQKYSRASIVDFYSPHNIYLNIQDQFSCIESQKLQY